MKTETEYRGKSGPLHFKRCNCGDFLKLAPLILSVFLLFSCSYSRACYDNLTGIFAADSGDYSRALSAFSRAASSGGAGIEKYTEYNAASVYRDLGEFSSAEKKFMSIDPGDEPEFAYRLYSELGALAYRSGEYEKAATFIKKAVLIDNSDIKLIRNLELALLMMEETRDRDKKDSEKESLSAVSEIDGTNNNARRLLDLMFSVEAPYWMEKSGEKKVSGKDW